MGKAELEVGPRLPVHLPLHKIIDHGRPVVGVHDPVSLAEHNHLLVAPRFRGGAGRVAEHRQLVPVGNRSLPPGSTRGYEARFTPAACGPFCPWVTSYSTFCPSSRFLYPS